MKKPLFHFRYLFYPFIMFLVGIIVARNLFCGELVTVLTVVVGLTLMIVLSACFKKYKAVLIMLAFFLIGNGTYFLSEAVWTPKAFEGNCIVSGRVYYVDGDASYAFMDDAVINGESVANVRVSLATSENVKVGDRWVFVSSVETVNLFYNGNTNSTFVREGIKYFASMQDGSATFVGDGQFRYDEILRFKIKEMLNNNLPSEQAGICYAMMFGDKTNLDTNVKDAFSLAGISHILTVSGLHVGFLISLIYAFLSLVRVKRLPTTIISTLILILYNVLCGFAPAVVRASLMAIVLMFAKLSGREYDGLNAIGFAGFVTLLVQPLYAFDIGFLMSYGCITTIFLLGPALSKMLNKFLPLRLGDGLSVSICATLGILPFLAKMGQGINLLSAFINLIILPLFSIFYPILFIISIFCLIFSVFAPMLCIFSPILTCFVAVANFFSGTSAYLSIAPFSIATIILYFCLFVAASRLNMMEKKTKFVVCCVIYLLLVGTIFI